MAGRDANVPREGSDHPVESGLEALLDLLTRQHCIDDRAGLEAAVVEAITIHRKAAQQHRFADSLDELAESAQRTLDLMNDDLNAKHLRWKGGAGRVEELRAGLAKGLTELRELARRAHIPESGPGAHAEAAHAEAVRVLTRYWVETLGRIPTSHWYGPAPITPFTEFLYRAMEFIAPQRQNALPRVTRDVVGRLAHR